MVVWSSGSAQMLGEGERTQRRYFESQLLEDLRNTTDHVLHAAGRDQSSQLNSERVL